MHFDNLCNCLVRGRFFFSFFLNVKACFLGKIGRNIKLSSTELAQRMININLFRKGVLTFFLYPVMWFNPINYSYQGHSLPFSVKSSIIFWVECGVGNRSEKGSQSYKLYLNSGVSLELPTPHFRHGKM